MSKPVSFDDIFTVMAAASIGDESARVAVPEDATPNEAATFGIALNVLLDDLALRASTARTQLEQKLAAEKALRESETQNRQLLFEADRVAHEQRSERKFADLLDSAPDAMLILDRAATIVALNAQTETLFGYPRAELVGQPLATLVASRYRGGIEKSSVALFSEMRTRPMDSSRELFGLRRDGTEFPMEASSNPFETSDGLFACTALRDISVRKSQESALLLANRELEAFSYSVAHDLRAPLRGMNGFAQILLEDYGEKLDDEGREYLNGILKSSVRMAGLIDALLTLSRVTRTDLKPEWISLSSVAQTVAADLAHAHTERGVKFIAEENLHGLIDRVLFRTLMDNLLSNAWKFTSRNPAPEVSFGAVELPAETAFFVRDNGVGFDMAFAKKLFVPFQRLHAQGEFPGTGIGLATVQRIVQRHGGRVWAEGTPNTGATFYFTLPGVEPTERGETR